MQHLPLKTLIAAVPVLGTVPAWLVQLGLIALILLVAIGLQHVLMPIVRRRAEKAPPLVKRVYIKTRGIARFAFVMFAVDFALPLVPLPNGFNDDIRRVLGAAAVVLVGWIVLIATNLAADRYIGGFRLDVSDNLLARKAVTQARVLKRALGIIICLITGGFALMTFDSVRQFGISLFASAGVAGIIAGFAAQQFLANIFAGIQLAITQPLRLEDVVVIDGEFGWVEEVTSTYVVVRLWDWRRLVVPIKYLFDNPFQNWTRASSAIIGNFLFYVDYSAPVDLIRQKVVEFANQSKNWDQNIVNLQVTDLQERVMQLRVLLSASDASKAWDLRAEVREKLIAFIQNELPHALPRQRTQTSLVARAEEDEKSDGDGSFRPLPPH